MKKKPDIKILYVGSFQGPSNAWRRKERLKSMGYEVREMNTSKLGLVEWQLVRRLIIRFSKPIFIGLLERILLRIVKREKPELIFFEKSQWLKPSAIKRVRATGPQDMVLAHYNPDEFFRSGNPNKWGYFLEAIPYYDVHFIPKPLNVKDYKKYGGRNIFVFDRSYDPSFHRPVKLTEEEKKRFGCLVGFIGKWAPHREAVIAELIQNGIKVTVWGNGWYRGKHWKVIQPHWRGPAQYGENYPKAICGMQIALHFLRKENLDEQDSRSFELPACGSCMIAERSPAHERLFKEGIEALYFDTTSDLIRLLNEYIPNPEKCYQIGKNAYARCSSSPYDHDSRLKEFLQYIKTVT